MNTHVPCYSITHTLIFNASVNTTVFDDTVATRDATQTPALCLCVFVCVLVKSVLEQTVLNCLAVVTFHSHLYMCEVTFDTHICVYV